MDPKWWFRLLVGAACAVLLGYMFRPVLELLVLAFVFAYIARPLAVKLSGWGVNATLSSSIAFVLVLLVLLLFLGSAVPVLSAQFKQIALALPRLEDWLQQRVVPHMQELGLEFNTHQDIREYLDILGSGLQSLGQMLAVSTLQLYQSGAALLVLLLKFALFPVIAFYLVKNYDSVVDYVAGLVPGRARPTVYPMVSECNQVLSSFVTGQLSLMVILAGYYVVSLSLVGLEQAFLIGLVIGLLCFIPLLGTLVGFILVMVSTALQFGDWTYMGIVLGIFVVGQLLENIVLAPFLVGSRLGLHPVAVLLGLLVCGNLFGFMGILLALPLTVVALVVYRHVHAKYVDSDLHA